MMALQPDTLNGWKAVLLNEKGEYSAVW